MAVGERYFTPYSVEVNPTGVPIAAARLFFYITGTATPLATFSDAGLTTPNTNPVTADANGRFGSIWLSPSQAYKVELWTAATIDDPIGALIWTADPVGPGVASSLGNTTGMISEIRAFAGRSEQVPSGWAMCFGQAISRATFSALFDLVGTTYGVGDGFTTFNLPDLRGRGIFGLDDMGGIAANRITAGGSGIPASTLGGTGGDQLLQFHTHGLNDPGHNHPLVDPEHRHNQQNFASGPVGGPVNAIPGTGGGAGVVSATPTFFAKTGIFIDPAPTNVSIANTGGGSSQNMPPAMTINYIIYLGA